MDREKEKQYVEKENPYAAVELTADELGMTEQSEGAVEKKAQGQESGKEKNGESGAGEKEGDAGDAGENAGVSPAKISIGGKEYDEAVILEALQDSQNKKKWQSESTQRDQEAAAIRKAVEPVVQLVNKLREKGEVADDIRTYLVEAFGEEISPVVDAALSFDPEKFPNPYAKELAERDKKIAELEGMETLRDEGKALAAKYKLTPEVVDGVMEFAVKYFDETGHALGLEEAYKLKNYDELAAKKTTPPPPPPPPNGRGARDIKKSETVPKSYSDVDISEFKLTE